SEGSRERQEMSAIHQSNPEKPPPERLKQPLIALEEGFLLCGALFPVRLCRHLNLYPLVFEPQPE
ncbi:hypothetical protein, partial [Deinococcus saxicola]|uniref:hypothetical protein n=1 Tax=Deinococcus saxicola TaxID=249406 RepID=UPI003D10FE5E